MVNILIVEDSPTQAAKLDLHLTQLGLQPTIAIDGEAALDLLDREIFDLVISDIVMPGISGYELCRQIKSSDRWRNIPVILLTTLRDPMDIIQGLEAGADNFFTKPYEPDQLIKRVNNVLENRRLASEGKLRVGFEVSFLGRRFAITSDRQQILDLLISTFEQIIETNRELSLRKEELAIARARVENYARQLEEKVEVSERRYQALMQNAGHAIFTADRNARILTFNRVAEDLFQLSAEEALGMSLDDIAEIPEGLSIAAATARYFEGGPSLYVDRGAKELICRRKDGTTFPFEAVVTDVTFGEDKVLCISGRDVTERREAQEALRASAEQISLLLDSTGEGIYAIDLTGNCTLCNPAAARMLGYNSTDELVGRPDIQKTILRSVSDDAGDGAGDRLIERIVREGKSFQSDNEVLWRKDGTSFPVHLSAYPIRRSGVIIGMAVTFSDSTERRQLENELRHAQKMEAIGKLTGGIAHDFNNLLTVVIGNLELLEDTVTENPQAAQFAKSALGAAIRGADLTKRLLAFARRQVLEAVVCDVKDLVGGLEDMLRRALGEDVALKMNLGSSLWKSKIDPGQFEHALLNLAVNARDAMEGGGALTVEASNEYLDEAYAEAHAEVNAGPYVMVAVSDTGSGMPPEVIEKAFEPFFTTKPIGKGTGLGLSMVYGFIKQSGGHVKIYSEMGQGTTIKLYLPAERDAASADPLTKLDASFTKFATSGEVVLLVEDDPSVQQIGAAILEYLGYKVIRVDDGPAALAVLESGERIDLLFTDIIMRGGMNGIDLAQRVRQKWPALKVLFCSGYAENAFTRRDVLEPGTAFISKPYDRIKLAAILRKILDDTSKAALSLAKV